MNFSTPSAEQITLQIPSSASRLRAKTKDKLTDQARKWVGLSFFEPVLKEARESPFHKKNPLNGGKSADMLGSLQDEQFAMRMTSGNSKLVKSIVNRIQAGRAYAQHQPRAVLEHEGFNRIRIPAA